MKWEKTTMQDWILAYPRRECLIRGTIFARSEDLHHAESKVQKGLAATNLREAPLLQDHGDNGKTRSSNSFAKSPNFAFASRQDGATN